MTIARNLKFFMSSTLDEFSKAEKKEISYVFPLTEATEKTKKRVQVHKFKGKILVDIRELYQNDDGEWCPGKKGISLSVEQVSKLKELTPLIGEAIKQLGGSFEE